MGIYQPKHNNVYCLCGCGARLGKGQQKYKFLECNRRHLNTLAKRKRAKNKADRLRQRAKKALLTHEQRSANAKLASIKRWEGKTLKTYVPKPSSDPRRDTLESWSRYLMNNPGYAEGVLQGRSLEMVSGSMSWK